jgi:hypothetical protein
MRHRKREPSPVIRYTWGIRDKYNGQVLLYNLSKEEAERYCRQDPFEYKLDVIAVKDGIPASRRIPGTKIHATNAEAPLLFEPTYQVVVEKVLKVC